MRNFLKVFLWHTHWEMKKREREKKGKKEIVEKFVTTFYVHKSFMEKKERKKKRWKKKEKFVELIYFARLTE